jgi:hypothetical protein
MQQTFSWLMLPLMNQVPHAVMLELIVSDLP